MENRTNPVEDQTVPSTPENQPSAALGMGSSPRVYHNLTTYESPANRENATGATWDMETSPENLTSQRAANMAMDTPEAPPYSPVVREQNQPGRLATWGTWETSPGFSIYPSTSRGTANPGNQPGRLASWNQFPGTFQDTASRVPGGATWGVQTSQPDDNQPSTSRGAANRQQTDTPEAPPFSAVIKFEQNYHRLAARYAASMGSYLGAAYAAAGFNLPPTSRGTATNMNAMEQGAAAYVKSELPFGVRYVPGRAPLRTTLRVPVPSDDLPSTSRGTAAAQVNPGGRRRVRGRRAGRGRGRARGRGRGRGSSTAGSRVACDDDSSSNPATQGTATRDTATRDTVTRRTATRRSSTRGTSTRSRAINRDSTTSLEPTRVSARLAIRAARAQQLQAAEAQPVEKQPAEEQPAEDQTAVDQPAEVQPAEEQPAEDQPSTSQRLATPVNQQMATMEPMAPERTLGSPEEVKVFKTLRGRVVIKTEYIKKPRRSKAAQQLEAVSEPPQMDVQPAREPQLGMELPSEPPLDMQPQWDSDPNWDPQLEAELAALPLVLVTEEEPPVEQEPAGDSPMETVPLLGRHGYPLYASNVPYGGEAISSVPVNVPAPEVQSGSSPAPRPQTASEPAVRSRITTVPLHILFGARAASNAATSSGNPINVPAPENESNPEPQTQTASEPAGRSRITTVPLHTLLGARAASNAATSRSTSVNVPAPENPEPQPQTTFETEPAGESPLETVPLDSQAANAQEAMPPSNPEPQPQTEVKTERVEEVAPSEPTGQSTVQAAPVLVRRGFRWYATQPPSEEATSTSVPINVPAAESNPEPQPQTGESPEIQNESSPEPQPQSASIPNPGEESDSSDDCIIVEYSNDPKLFIDLTGDSD